MEAILHKLAALLAIIMIINSQPPISPALNREPIRPQSSADSSPESTVIQDQKVAPVPDVRVVQQANETASGNGLKDPKLDIEQEAKPPPLGAEEKQAASGQEKVNSHVTLTESEQRQVQQLADRDREVRTHEQAHLSAAGSRATSGASFTYTDGPDGKRYATGGEVSVDTSPVQGDPEATLRAAELIQRAALAPAEPSAQDRQVAAAANAMAQVASAELSQQRVDESQARTLGSSGSESPSFEGDAEITGETVVEAAPGSGVSSEQPSAVERRDLQTQKRQQLLEDAFSSVQRGLNDGPLGTNIDSFNPMAQVSSAAQPPVVDVSTQARQSGAEVNTATPEVRSVPANAAEGGQAEVPREASLMSGEVVPPGVSMRAPADAGDASPDVAPIDSRDEQVKNRQQQLEGAFSAGAQGLGGEPRGTNLDYFL